MGQGIVNLLLVVMIAAELGLCWLCAHYGSFGVLVAVLSAVLLVGTVTLRFLSHNKKTNKES